MEENEGNYNCDSFHFKERWITQKDDKTMLFGGDEDHMDFDITNLSIDPCGFKFGLGREAFSALITPEFISLDDADKLYPNNSRFLLAESGGVVRAYSVNLLIQHEVVNDNINGHPIMAAYCVLADLGAIYTREYCDRTYTFALSGYTYSDQNVWGGINAFVLWDRDTESLWWPLIDRAISGPMDRVELEKFDGKWMDTTWGHIKEKYNQVDVLKSNQTMEVPTNWPTSSGCQ